MNLLSVVLRQQSGSSRFISYFDKDTNSSVPYKSQVWAHLRPVNKSKHQANIFLFLLVCNLNKKKDVIMS